MKTKPMTMLLAMLAGWMNQQQQQIIDYLKEENEILKTELLKATRTVPMLTSAMRAAKINKGIMIHAYNSVDKILSILNPT
jgi:hypothetical protein